MTTDAPRTDACPHCGAKYLRRRVNWNGLPLSAPTLIFTCRSKISGNGFWYRSDYCKLLEARDIAESYREARQKAEAELAKTNETLAIVWTDFEEMMPLKKKAEAELAELWSRFDNQMQAEAEVDKMKAVVEAARCIRHWHCREPDGMVVSKEAVMRLWDSLSELDQTKSPLNQSI